MSYEIKEPHITYVAGNGDTLEKGRIQVGINGNPSLHEFYVEEKLYVHPDFSVMVNQSSAINWLTVQEFWNNASASSLPFRITLNLQKEAGAGTDFYFGAHGQTKIGTGNWDSKWAFVDTIFALPLGEWITIKTHFVEGDSLNGKLKVSITDAQNSVHEVINVTGFTHHPNDPNPDGVSNFNPLKLYTSGELIDFMDSANACLCLYWDDFKVWTDSALLSGIAENDLVNDLLVHPIPVKNVLNYKTSERVKSIEVYALSGKLVDRIDSDLSKAVDLSFLPGGVYILRFIFEVNGEKRIKILKD